MKLQAHAISSSKIPSDPSLDWAGNYANMLGLAPGMTYCWLAGNEGMKALYNPLNGIYGALIPSFPANQQQAEGGFGPLGLSGKIFSACDVSCFLLQSHH